MHLSPPACLGLESHTLPLDKRVGKNIVIIVSVFATDATAHLVSSILFMVYAWWQKDKRQ